MRKVKLPRVPPAFGVRYPTYARPKSVHAHYDPTIDVARLLFNNTRAESPSVASKRVPGGRLYYNRCTGEALAFELAYASRKLPDALLSALPMRVYESHRRPP
jgi:hypothetical protein